MIQANELRTGNKIIRDGSIVTVGWGTLKAIAEEVNVGDPIPLTPEILEKCGALPLPYNKPGVCLIINKNVGLCFYKTGAVQIVTIINNDGEYTQKTETDVNVLYLHQLQNLYFALTGEELNVQL